MLGQCSAVRNVELWQCYKKTVCHQAHARTLVLHVYVRYKQRWASNYLKPQIRKFSSKYCTTLSQNSPNGRLFETIFIFFTLEFVRRKSMYLRTFGSLNPQITKKIWAAKRKSAKCHICGRTANLRNY